MQPCRRSTRTRNRFGGGHAVFTARLLPAGLPLAGLLPAGLLLAGLLLGGCQQTSETVYVELPEVEDLKVPTVPRSSMTFEMPAASWRLPELGPTTGPSEGATTSRVKSILAANRERRYKQLLDRLLADYRRKATILREQRIKSFEKVRSAELDKAYQLISDEYTRYANQKGPLVVRVAFLASFPDPDPLSRRPPSEQDFAATRRFNQAKEARAEIGRLDASFAAFVTQKLHAAGMASDAEIAGLLQDLEEELARIEENTRQQAATELSRTQAELKPLLADRSPSLLPSEPARTLTLPAQSLKLPEIEAPSVSPEVLAEPRERIREELRVWLRVNRYVTGRKGKCRDATHEFLTWRQTFNPPPR